MRSLHHPYAIAAQVRARNATTGAFHQRLNLILEEGEKGAEHDRNALGEDGGNLETQTLPSTRALQHKNVSTRHGSRDNVPLVVSVGRVLERVAESKVWE